jgi:hypothetical protein
VRKKNGLQIIYENRNRASLAEHARDLVVQLDEQQMQRAPWQVRPRNVPTHLAMFPVRCDDCAEQFWAHDEFGKHIGCKHGKGRPGF